MKIFLKIVYCLLVVCVVLFILWFGVTYFLFGRGEIRDASYKNSYGDKAVISHPSFWEISLAYDYRAYKNKSLVVSPIYIHDTQNFEKFEFINIPDSRIIGVVQKSRPNALLVMHDFETDQVWVCGHDNRKAEIDILGKLQNCYPERNYHSADMSIERIPEMDPREAIEAVENQWQVSFPDTIKEIKAAFFTKADHPQPNYIIKLKLDKEDYRSFLEIFGQKMEFTNLVDWHFVVYRSREKAPYWFIEPIETGEVIEIQANEQCQQIYEQYLKDVYGREINEKCKFEFYSDMSKDDEVVLYLRFLATEPELFN